jgi:hypothetical protein
LENQRKKEEMEKQNQEYDRLENLEGNFPLLLFKIKNSQTNHELNFVGIDLKEAEYRLLFKVLEKNTSVKAIICNRK